MMEGRAGSQEQPLTLEERRFWQQIFHWKLWTIKTGKKKLTDSTEKQNKIMNKKSVGKILKDKKVNLSIKIYIIK